MNKDDIVLIKNWKVVDGKDAYTAPEVTKLRIVGTVYGHPFKPDGKKVITSPITSLGKFREGSIVETSSGTLYKLGEMDSDYKKWWENLN